MKKVIFGMLTCVLLASAAFADGGKKAAKAEKVKAVAENCCKEDCPQTCAKSCADMPCCSKK